jgi:hypothetical protein
LTGTRSWFLPRVITRRNKNGDSRQRGQTAPHRPSLRFIAVTLRARSLTVRAQLGRGSSRPRCAPGVTAMNPIVAE